MTIVYIRRGGVPENPDNFFDDEYVMAVEGVPDDEQSIRNDSEREVWVEGDPMIKPNTVQVGADGPTYLVAEIKLEDAESGICTRDN